MKEKEGRTPLKQIKVLYSDPAKLEPQIEDHQEEIRAVFRDLTRPAPSHSRGGPVTGASATVTF